MKKRSGWTVTPDPLYSSGFKNNGPYYQAHTNLDGGNYGCLEENSRLCKVKTATNEGGYSR